jgi:uncharacterized lipoprotein YehR (DUF1307 family)
MQTIVTLSTIFTFVIASILSINIIICNPNNHNKFNDDMKASKKAVTHQGYRLTSVVAQSKSVNIQSEAH